MESSDEGHQTAALLGLVGQTLDEPAPGLVSGLLLGLVVQLGSEAVQAGFPGVDAGDHAGSGGQMSPGPVGHPGVVGVPEGNGSHQGFEVGSPDVPVGEVQQADQEPAHDRFVEAPDAVGVEWHGGCRQARVDESGVVGGRWVDHGNPV